LSLSPLITHRFSLDDIKTAFETYKQKRGLKIIIQP